MNTPQQCNFLACWTTDNTLSWDGQCVTLASGYGVFPGLHRMCARVAIPADYKENFSQDPGYTVKKHLNFEGMEVSDEIIYVLCARYFSPPLRQMRSPLHTNFFAAFCHPPC